MNRQDAEKKLAALEAVKHIHSGMIVGLGTGSTAYYAVLEISRLVSEGLHIQAVPTSEKTKALAIELHIPLIDINTIDAIDMTIDGADEFTKDRMLIKGGGGALLREKIVASLTREEIIIADSGKLVEQLGKFTVPIEVIPFACNAVLQKLKSIQGHGTIRQNGEGYFITDQGNYIIDVDFGLIDDPVKLASSLDSITGIVEHGLFIGMAKKVIMGKDNRVIVFE